MARCNTWCRNEAKSTLSRLSSKRVVIFASYNLAERLTSIHPKLDMLTLTFIPLSKPVGPINKEHFENKDNKIYANPYFTAISTRFKDEISGFDEVK